MRSAALSRTAETLGMLAIGDGIVALYRPSRHAQLWSGGPKLWKNFMEGFARRPRMTRGLALAEIGLGLWLARVATDYRRDRVTR